MGRPRRKKSFDLCTTCDEPAYVSKSGFRAEYCEKHLRAQQARARAKRPQHHEDERTCRQCRQTKPLEAFTEYRGNRRARICQQCKEGVKQIDTPRCPVCGQCPTYYPLWRVYGCMTCHRNKIISEINKILEAMK